MKKRNVIILLFSTVVAISAASIGITIAWYSSGAAAQVDNIKLSITGDKNLLISTSGLEDTFKEELTKDDLIKVDKFMPVSSMHSSTWIANKESKPKFYVNPISGSKNPTPTISTTGYYSQELYLKSDYSCAVSIDKNEVNFRANESINKEVAKGLQSRFPEYTLSQIEENLNKIYKSLRLSVLVPDVDNYQYAILDPNKDGDTYLAGILDMDNNSYYDTYKDNNYYECVYGEVTNRDKIVFDDPKEEEIKEKSHSCFIANHYNNAYRFNKEKSISNGAILAIENSYSLDEIETGLEIPVKAFEARKILLSIYLEGWDLENTDLSMYASFLLDFKFKITKEI